MQRIGLTGGIGSGKSTVTERMRALGIFVTDADAISRALLQVDGGCYDAVAAAFPSVVLAPGAPIDRRALAGIVFADNGARETLNGIVHPAVRRTMRAEVDAYLASHPDAFAVYDVPLLLEGGLYREMDGVLVVTADREIRILRVIRRDGCTRFEAEARLDAQMPEDERMTYADFIIENNGTLEALYQQVDALCRTLLEWGAHAEED